MEQYKPHSWEYNGARALRRVIRRINYKNVTSEMLSEMLPELTWGFEIFPRSTFFPIDWSTIQNLFDSNQTVIDKVKREIQNSVAVNAWGRGHKIRKSKPSIYRMLAEKHCPKVYEASDPVF